MLPFITIHQSSVFKQRLSKRLSNTKWSGKKHDGCFLVWKKVFFKKIVYCLLCRKTLGFSRCVFQSFSDKQVIIYSLQEQEYGFDVLLTVHLSIFISLFNQLDAQNLFHNKFYFMPLHVSSTCAHHQVWWYQRLCNAILTSWWWAHMLETCRGTK